MIVLDASALVELVLDSPTGRLVAGRIADPAEGLHVPHLADIEVVSALHRYVQDGEIDAAAAAVALDDLRALDLQRARAPARGGARRSLLTCDRRLSRAPGISRRVVLVAAERPTR